MFCLVLATLKASCDGKGYNSMTDFYSTLVDRALNRIYGEELGPEQPKDTTIGGIGGRPMSELEGTTTAADAAEPEMPVATDAVLNAVNKMKDYTTKPLANITYVPLKAASKEASLRRNTMLDLLLAGEEEGALPDGFAKMYDYGEVEFSALDYLDKLKSDYDRKTKATIDVPMQDKRVMDTVDPQFPMPTSTREPQYVSLEDAPDADIVLDRPTQIETQGLGSRPVAETQTDDGQDLAMPANIDFDFIGQQEGVKSSMYVPKKNGQVLGDSGPTIGIGLDLGQRNVSDLKGLSPELIEKLSPYTGMKGSEADSFVENNPLTLTSDELTEVNAWTKKTETDKLLKRWAEDSDIAWSDLTPQQATVVASVSYQYGTGAPKFWSHVTSGDWDAAESELRDFGDEYKSRRLREAKYLAGN